jgi:glycosyltransferase involved in cell wall biosynthesis
METKGNNFLALGRLEYQKGFDLLIDIFAKFKQKNSTSDWKLYIVGDGSQRKKLIQQIADLNLNDDIIMVGASMNVKKYYSMSKIFLLSSRWEGMPLVLDEALMFGLPVIAFDCKTGPREMLSENRNSFIVPMEDMDDFVKKMIVLSSTPSLLQEFSLNCNLSTERRSDKAIFKKWHELLISLE